MLEGIDYGIDSNPNFSIMFIQFNLAVYSNPPLSAIDLKSTAYSTGYILAKSPFSRY